jgi:hypothetical protein
MSTFTSQVSRSSGILSSEPTMVLFTALKKFSFQKLNGWRQVKNADWKKMLSAIENWSSEQLAAEKDEFVNYADDAASRLQYTILRALKTKHMKMRGITIGEADLEKISLEVFLHEYWKNLIKEEQIQNGEPMSTSDKHIAAQDAFRSAVYSIANSIQTRETPAARKSGVLPEDSVSVAPSEVISEYASHASQKSGLRGSIESLYENKLEGPAAAERSHVSRKSLRSRTQTHRSQRTSATKRTPVPSQFASRRSRRATEPIPEVTQETAEEMVVDIPSESGGSRRSKFSRSPSRVKTKVKDAAKKPDDGVPKFFDSQFSRLRDDGTILSRMTAV